jgi:c-di-GMP-binding flagellar brake protein YcgR
MVDFNTQEAKTTGITYDISLGGMFVRTSRMPEEGKAMLATMRFSDGRQLLIQGRVVRTFRAPALLRDQLPTGFGMAVTTNESYARFVSWVAVRAS